MDQIQNIAASEAPHASLITIIGPRFAAPAYPFPLTGQVGVSNQPPSVRIHRFKDPTPRRELVGQTPVREIAEVSEYFGVQRLLIKDESHNPCGTHKDRKSVFVVRRALTHPSLPSALCLITAGSAALSLSYFAPYKRLPVVAFMGAISKNSRRQLDAVCLKTINLDLEERKWSSRDLQLLAGKATGREVLDVTNVATPYSDVAQEIAPYRPDVIVLPVGGGEFFVGLAAGLRSLGLRTRLIGVSIRRRDTAADKLYASYSPYREVVNSLTSGSSPHRLIYLDDETGLAESQNVLSKFVPCEPSSVVAFDALRSMKFKPWERVMVINTGTFRWPVSRAGSPLPAPAF